MNQDHSPGVPDARVAVKVWGMDSGGRAFRVNATAHERSLQGARLDGVDLALFPGEIIGVQCGDQKSRFRVVWIGQPNSSQAGQIGIKALEVGRCIWPIDAPQSAASVRPNSGVAPRQDRRQHTRYHCEGNVGLGPVGSEVRTWGKLADISLVAVMALPAPLGTELQINIHTKYGDVSLVSTVRTSVPNLGMGMEFSTFVDDSRERLEQLIAQITGSGLTRGPDSAPATPPPTAGDDLGLAESTTLIAAIEQFFEGTNVLTREEFLTLVQDVRGKSRKPH